MRLSWLPVFGNIVYVQNITILNKILAQNLYIKRQIQAFKKRFIQNRNVKFEPCLKLEHFGGIFLS